MKEKELFSVPLYFSDFLFAIIGIAIIALFAKTSLLVPVVVITLFLVVFILFTKRYKFYETYFITEGLVFKSRRIYKYQSVVQAGFYNNYNARSTISLLIEGKKRVNVPVDRQTIHELIAILNEVGIKVVDKRR